MWKQDKKKWLLIAFVLVFAAFFAFLTLRSVNQYLNDEIQKAEAKNRLQTAPRVVFNHSLLAGSVIEASDLAVREVPIDFMPADSFAPDQYESLLGKVLKYSVYAGETALPHQVQYATQPTFSDRLQQGRRALSISVDRINSISGLVRPGDLIDIYVSFDYQRRKITAPLLQGVYVLATDQHVDESSHAQSGFTTMTLDLSPEDAAKLVAAKQSAEITAMLRNPADEQTSVRAVRNDIATLLGLRNPIENLNNARKVKVIYGNTVQRGPLGPLRPNRVYRAPPAVFDLSITEQLSSAAAEHSYGESVSEPFGGSFDDSFNGLNDEPFNSSHGGSFAEPGGQSLGAALNAPLNDSLTARSGRQ